MDMSNGIVTSRECKDLIVVRVDGGICSQISFVALGLLLAKKGCHVKYDLTWYRTNGKDLCGKFVRNWDFPKAFPNIAVEEATSAEIDGLRRRRFRMSEMVESFEPPLYVGGYPDCDQAIVSEISALRRGFRPELDCASRMALEEVQSGPACAVHVRRGDLANGNPHYGSATSHDYFHRAMTIVSAIEPGVRFYFFSDEPDWVRRELLSLVPGGRGQVIDVNGSDKGYLDLYMMSKCDYVIGSLGSLGVLAAVLSECNKMLVMSTNRAWVSANFRNVCYLNDDCGRRPASCRDELMCRVPERRLHGLWRCAFALWRKSGEFLFVRQ